MIRWRPVLVGAVVQFVATAAYAFSADEFGSILFSMGLLGGFVAGVLTTHASDSWVDGCLAAIAGALLFTASVLVTGTVAAYPQGEFVGSYVFGSYAVLALSILFFHVPIAMFTGLFGGVLGGKVKSHLATPTGFDG